VKRPPLVLVALVMGVFSLFTRADPAPTALRIGTLTPPAFISAEQGLQEGLSDLGYKEGSNLIIERRPAGSSDALQSGAADLVRTRVDLIVAFGTPAARAALSATSTIPVVFLSGDPVGTGLAASLARPGANGTGISSLSTELMPKRLELLQQIAPRIRSVILLGNPSSPLHAGVLKEAQEAAHKLHIQVIAVNARNAEELDPALTSLQHGTTDAVLVTSDVLFLANKAKVASAVAKAKLPAIFPWRDYHDAGVLMSYGVSAKEMGHQAAAYVDRIVRGAKPGELPIEQMSKYELIINLRVAREVGIKVPQELLLRADEVLR